MDDIIDAKEYMENIYCLINYEITSLDTCNHKLICNCIEASSELIGHGMSMLLYTEYLRCWRDVVVKANKKEKNTITYIIKDILTGIYKIGKTTKDVNKRMSQLGIGKSSLQEICVFQKDVENYLHKAYKHKRVRGEWFKLTKCDIDDIKKQFI